MRQLSLLSRHIGRYRTEFHSSASILAVSPPQSSSLITEFRASNPIIDRMLRVNHAGELGAVVIYSGQMSVLSSHPVAPVIRVFCYIYLINKFIICLKNFMITQVYYLFGNFAIVKNKDAPNHVATFYKYVWCFF